MLNFWHPSLLNIIQASVWQRILAYQNTIIPEPFAKEGTLHIITGAGSPCLVWAWGQQHESGREQLRSGCTHSGLCALGSWSVPTAIVRSRELAADSFCYNRHSFETAP